MKFVIWNDFSEEDACEEKYMQIAPFDYDKFKDGRVVEFDTAEELIKFLKEAQDTIYYVGKHDWDYIDVCVRYTNTWHDDEMKLRIAITNVSIG